MRLWSIHPCYLDTKGLTALWRESLLARKVLKNETRRYKHHPQLTRFRENYNPIDSINFYLSKIHHEAQSRNYKYDSLKLESFSKTDQIPVTRGQIIYEFSHLLNKLKIRDRARFEVLSLLKYSEIECHPIFQIIDGEIEDFEKIV